MEEGKIIETGSHNELMNGGGRYFELWKEQLPDNLEDSTKKNADDIIKLLDKKIGDNTFQNKESEVNEVNSFSQVATSTVPTPAVFGIPTIGLDKEDK